MLEQTLGEAVPGTPIKSTARRRTEAVLRALFVFSPEGRVLFWATVLMHVALKMLLGLSAAMEDRYGFRSLMAPPQSFVLAAGDIGVCFLLSKVSDWVIPARWRKPVFTFQVWFVFAYLAANFIVHSYFKMFINRGLIAFNGAPMRELADYAVAGANRYAVCFIMIAFTCAALVTHYHARLLNSRFIARRNLPVTVLILNVASMAYISQKNQGQLGFMALNPGYVLYTSYRGFGKDELTPRATPDEAKRFVEPGPILGEYDSALDISPIRRPRANVLFVLIESLPWEQTPLGGATGGLTVLDELASDAITFNNFRTVFPATSRSFLTYHCGIYPSVGLTTPTRFLPSYRCDSLLTVLEAAGYRTGFFTAPMFNYDNLSKSPTLQQYDRYEDFLTLKNETHAITAPAVSEELVVDALLDFVAQEPGRPFLATYFMFWNHAPYRLPDQDISALPPLERYRRTLDYLDKALREALAGMKNLGLLDNTIVVVAADHGEGFALHHDNVNHSGHIYEDDIKVPFLIHVPGLGRHTTNRQGSNVDFATTLTAMLELPQLASWQGQDLLADTYTPRPTLLYGRAAFATIGLVDGNFKYIQYLGRESKALYDLKADPFEQSNLLDRLPDHAARYRSVLDAWLPVVEQRSWAVNEH